MNSRQRVQATLSHRQPDRVPMDFGATGVSGMHCTAVAALREHFGLERHPVKINEPYQMLGLIEADLAQAMGVDRAQIPSRMTNFGYRNDNWKLWRTPWGQEVLVGAGFQTTRSPEGDVYIYPQGDLNAPASGHMPASGYFFDTIIRQDPIDDDKLDPRDNLEEYQPLTARNLADLREDIAFAEATGRAVVCGAPGTAFGDIGRIPGSSLKHPKGIRDVAEWYMSVATRQDYIHAVFEQQAQIALANLERMFQAVGNRIDVVYVCGTDFGTQSSQFCSVDTFRGLYKPYYQRVNGWIHQHTTWKTIKHSCGAVEPFIADFIDCGFDILNPVQCSATGMDPRKLKKDYGSRIVFWGGGVDTQHVLPFGTPGEVRKQVLERCDIFAPGGGFVFNTIHNVQARTPVQNLVAMLDAVHEFNGSK